MKDARKSSFLLQGVREREKDEPPLFSRCSPTRLTETSLIRAPHYNGQFALFLGEESPYFFSISMPPAQRPYQQGLTVL